VRVQTFVRKPRFSGIGNECSSISDGQLHERKRRKHVHNDAGGECMNMRLTDSEECSSNGQLTTTPARPPKVNSAVAAPPRRLPSFPDIVRHAVLSGRGSGMTSLGGRSSRPNDSSSSSSSSSRQRASWLTQSVEWSLGHCWHCWHCCDCHCCCCCWAAAHVTLH